ncbi:MAG: hypothetical protein IT462_15750 [Planctomycetes bacterium]|nr:hypothetical protein [Planctomycetota bacterium]
MNRERWINQLQLIGLNTYEAKVYLALLGETAAPVARIVRKSGVPQAKIYSVLQGLASRGFAQEVLGEIKHYRGVPPADALAAHQRSIQASMDQAGEIMQSLAKEAPDSPSEDPASLGIRLVRGAHVGQAVSEIIATTAKSLYVSVKAPVLVASERQEEQDLQRRGVNVRYLIERAAIFGSRHEEAMKALAREFHHTRVVDTLPFRYVVADGLIVMMELKEEDGSPMGLVIPNKGLAQGIEKVFNEIWGRAEILE